MSFKDTLSDLLERVPGSIGAILADWEGEAVDQVSSRMDEFEMKVIGAHKGIILANMRKAMRDLDSDDLQEIIVTTEKTQTLIIPITSDYYLVLTLQKDASFGRAQFEARKTVLALRAEIA
ncbi:MAG: GTPase-activating protein [Desulfuromonas sp.]|nr:MAG: GTPase-activating protein [Desulfuromonas sp.]